MRLPRAQLLPELILDEIQFILTHPHIAVQPELASKLHTFILKAQHGITKPSHLVLGKPSFESTLGFASEDHTIETLLDAWNSNPSILSQSQIARIQHHRYTHDLMTADEELTYEKSIWQR